MDFSIVFYGGALLSRLSAKLDDLEDPTLVDLWRINRRMWLLMDSDKGDGELKPAVQRLQREVAHAGTGGTWVTEGYTMENYVDPDALEAAVRTVHPSATGILDKDSAVDPLVNVVKADGGRLSRIDKVAIALAATASPANLDVLDLRARVAELATFIRASSREAVTIAPVAADVPPTPAE